MSDENKKSQQICLIWLLIIIISIVILSISAVYLAWVWWMWIPVSFFIIIGIVLTVMNRFFFDPKRNCPRCNTVIPSLYTEKCVKCGIKLLHKCNACGTFMNTYVGGQPVKFCNNCGVGVTLKIERIESPYLHKMFEDAARTRFCPTCGSNLEDEKYPKYCPLCGAGID